MALNLDMSKTYDRIEWAFVSEILKKMRFSTEWINLIMRYITSNSYSICLNNSTSPSF